MPSVFNCAMAIMTVEGTSQASTRALGIMGAVGSDAVLEVNPCGGKLRIEQHT
jgi:hypothetical protein